MATNPILTIEQGKELISFIEASQKEANFDPQNGLGIALIEEIMKNTAATDAVYSKIKDAVFRGDVKMIQGL